MGCDGWIEKPQEKMGIDIYCYTCGGKIDPDDPQKGHEKCVNEFGLPVRIEMDNYRER